jgi:ATP-binding cassette subfamily B protein
MINQVTIDQVSGNVPLAWRTYTGKRCIVHALDGSYAAKQAQAELRKTERVIAALADLLKPADEARDAHIHIYLVDQTVESSVGLPAQGNHRSDRAGVIVRLLQPETPGEPIAWPLARLLIPRWFGASVASATLFINGLAGVVAMRTGTGPTLEEVERWVQAELDAGRPVSIFAREASAKQSGDVVGRDSEIDSEDYTATLFVNYLIKEFGQSAIHNFLAAYDADRRDQAALTAYHRTLGALDEAWRGSLRRKISGGSAFRTLLQYLVPNIKPYWPRWLEMFLHMSFGLAFSLVLPFGFKYLIDTIIPSGNLNSLGLLSLGLLAAYVFNSASNVRRVYLTNWIYNTILMGMQARIFARLQRLPHGFYSRAKVGDLIARLSSDLNLVGQALSQVSGYGIFLAFKALIAAIALLVLSPMLGGLVLVVIPIFVVSYAALRSRLQNISYEAQKQLGESMTMAQENLSAHTVIKAFVLEERSMAMYKAKLQSILGVFLRLVMVSSLFETSIGLAITLGQLLVIGVGGYMVITGQLSVGTLIAAVALLPSLFEPVSTLANVGQSVEKAAGALQRVNELLDEPITIADAPNPAALTGLHKDIRFENVNFSYDTSRQILQDLNLTIPAGTHVSIVGPSGSGKSTIVNLLMRFWDPDHGRVLFDGQDLREVSLASLRGRIGIVFQDTFIFDSSLRDNIAIGKPDATDTEIAAAARAARLEPYIDSLPNGYDTVLGERGVMMSGGQRQRLAIARALLRDPSILILDEATSALDAQTEREILETLNELAQTRTTVSITHRLALAATADQVVVLNQGHVVEQGTHAELVQAGGLYQSLYEEQVNPVLGGSAAQDRTKLSRLQSIPLFSKLESEALNELSKWLTVEQFAAGQDVVRQGDAGDKLYIIGRGQVDVVAQVGASERHVCILEAGDYFGEMALLVGEPRNATVRSVVPTQLYSLAQTDFMTLLEREPKIREAVMNVVDARRVALNAVTTTAAAG